MNRRCSPSLKSVLVISTENRVPSRRRPTVSGRTLSAARAAGSYNRQPAGIAGRAGQQHPDMPAHRLRGAVAEDLLGDWVERFDNLRSSRIRMPSSATLTGAGRSSFAVA